MYEETRDLNELLKGLTLVNQWNSIYEIMLQNEKFHICSFITYGINLDDRIIIWKNKIFFVKVKTWNHFFERMRIKKKIDIYLGGPPVGPVSE